MPATRTCDAHARLARIALIALMSAPTIAKTIVLLHALNRRLYLSCDGLRGA
jgi:hypothetical protein